MKNFTVRHRIVGCFVLVLAVMIIMGAIAYDRFIQVGGEATNIQRDAVPGLLVSLQLMSAWDTQYALLQTQILENDPAAINAADVALEAHRTVVNTLMKQYQILINEDQERQIFASLLALSTQYTSTENTIVSLGDTNKDDSAREALKSQLRPIFLQLQADIQKLVDLNKTNSDAATGAIIASIAAARTSILVSFAIAVVVAAAGGYLLFRAITVPLSALVGVLEIMREGDFSRRLENGQRNDEFGILAKGFNRMADDLVGLIGQVQKAGVQVSTSVTEIAATSKQQQATATEIAATTTEIGATAKEISATSNELVRTMGDVSSVAEHTAALAGGGQAGLTRMEDTMRQVVAAAAAINVKLGTLNEKAGNINQVVTTITKVADQTNLLSLNAAIEAEKAGEYGRGFAVVATEIRRLADQTAVSTYDIEQMVKDIQSAVAASVMGMDKFSEEVRRGMTEMQQVGDQLSEIIGQVQGLAPRVESVNEGMQAQATGAEQISQALAQLSEAAQQTVESLRQTSVAMDELNHASTGLHGSILRFRLHA